MHAERLNSIAKTILSTFKDNETLKHLDALIATVTQRIANPADPAFDEKVSTDSKQLFASLAALEINKFTPIWLKIMIELGLSSLFPENIRIAVERAIQNRFVDSDLLTSLKKIKDDIQRDLDDLTKLRAGFDAIGLSLVLKTPSLVFLWNQEVCHGETEVYAGVQA